MMRLTYGLFAALLAIWLALPLPGVAADVEYLQFRPEFVTIGGGFGGFGTEEAIGGVILDHPLELMQWGTTVTSIDTDGTATTTRVRRLALDVCLGGGGMNSHAESGLSVAGGGCFVVLDAFSVGGHYDFTNEDKLLTFTINPATAYGAALQPLIDLIFKPRSTAEEPLPE